MRLILSLSVLCLFVGCKADQKYKNQYTEKIEIKEFGEDVKIPSDVWNLIEEKGIQESEKLKVGSVDSHAKGHDNAKPEAGKSSEAGEHGAPESGTVTASLTSTGNNFNFAPIKVYLTEKNKGVLRTPSVEILFPRGGGKIDLADYTTGVVGTFYVAFEMNLADGENLSTVHFVSNSRARRLEGKIVGAGCDTFMDIKDYLAQVQNSTGLVVNTNRNRHLSVLGGTFVFSAKGERETAVAQVTFTDQKQPEYFCDYLDKSKNERQQKNTDSDELELPQ